MPTLRQTLSLSEQLALAIRCQTPVRLASTFASLEGQFYDRTPFDNLARQVHAVRAHRCRCFPHPARPAAPRSTLGTGRLDRPAGYYRGSTARRVSAPPQRRALPGLVRTLRENGRLLAALAR